MSAGDCFHPRAFSRLIRCCAVAARVDKGTPNTGCPDRDGLLEMGWRDGMEECPGLWTVRCGAHKLHYVTKQWDTKPLFQDPPLICELLPARVSRSNRRF